MIRLTTAIAGCIQLALSATADELVRLDVPGKWPISEAIEHLIAECHVDGLRVGLLRNMGAVNVPEYLDIQVSRDATDITIWRNEKDRVAPVLVLGDARGPNEDGLADVESVISDVDVVDYWLQTLKTDGFGPGDAQGAEIQRDQLLRALFDLATKRQLDSVLLDDYVRNMTQAAAGGLESYGAELWRLDFFVDSDLFGVGTVGGRIERNRLAKLLILQPASDRKGDSVEERLRADAALGSDSLGARLLAWRDSRDRQMLDSIELSQVERLIDGKRNPPGVDPVPPPPPVDKQAEFFDFLTISESQDLRHTPEYRSWLLCQVEEAVALWSADSSSDDDQIELLAYEEGRETVTLKPARLAPVDDVWSPNASEQPEGDRYAAIMSQCVAFVAGGKSRITGSVLLEACLGMTPAGKDAVIAFLEARYDVLRWLATFRLPTEYLLPVLVANTELLENSQRYLAAFHKLLNLTVEETNDPTDQLRSIPVLLEGSWTWPSDTPDPQFSGPFDSVLTSPMHPLRIQPLVELAGEVRRAIRDGGESDCTVARARWAAERSVPAYPSLFTANGPLLHFAGETDACLRFEVRPHRYLPSLGNESEALRRMVEAYLQLHPWCREGLVINLINPPAGSGIPKFVRAVAQMVNLPNCVTVRVVASRDSGSGQLPILGDEDRYFSVAVVDDVDSWLDRSAPSAHITVLFVESLPASDGGVSPMAGGPTGAYSVITLEPRTAPVSLDASGIVKAQKVPKAVVKLDEANRYVADLANAVAPNGGVKGIDLQLQVRAEDSVTARLAARHSEWIAVAAPGMATAIDLTDGDSGMGRIQLGRLELGSYTLSVFARNLQPLREWLQSALRDFPVFMEVHRLEAQMRDLAHGQPSKLLELTVNQYGSVETLGLLVARALLSDEESANEEVAMGSHLVVEIPMDSSGWTRHWIPDGQRCDLLRIRISRDETSPQPIEITAVEAKARTDGFHGLSDQLTRDAAGQVNATIDCLDRLFDNSARNLIDSLQFRAFCEQVFSVVASTEELLTVEAEDEGILRNLSRLSEGKLGPDGVAIDGLVVCCWLGSAGATEYEDAVEGRVRMISTSGHVLSQILTDSLATYAGAREVQANVVREGVPAASGTEDLEVQPETGAAISGESGDEGSGDGVKRDDTELLDGERGSETFPEPVRVLAEKIHSSASRFNADVAPGDFKQVDLGPTFMTVSIPLAPGGRIETLVSNADNIAREAGVDRLQVENDPSRPYHVALRALRADREFPTAPTVSLQDSVAGDAYLHIPLGQDLRGRDFWMPISSWPHALVAGTTGSGKTTFLRGLLRSLGEIGSEYVQVAIVDGKGETDFVNAISDDSFVPEFPQVLFDPDDAIGVLEWLRSSEIPRRKELLRAMASGVGAPVTWRTQYAAAVRAGTAAECVPIVVVIDEFAEIMLRGKTYRDAFEDHVQSVAQVGRSSMVHLVLATQQPRAEIVPGAIKANLGTRFAFRLPTAADSQTILGHGGAEHLAGLGDFYLKPSSGDRLRLQGYGM